MSDLAERLQYLRERAGIRSQQALGEQLGVAKNRIWSYEKGKTLPDIDYLANFARHTGASLDELIGLRLEAGGHGIEAMTVTRDGDQAGYEVPPSLGPLRGRLAISVMPPEWAMFLTELAARGKISVSAAEEIADFFDAWEPSRQWLESFE